MNRILLLAGVPLASLLLTGCIDNKYDLDDIDTTTEIKVNNLVLPINLDVVRLSDIITIDEDSKIKEIDLDGKKVYAVTESGDFHSDPIRIPGFTAPSPDVADAEATFRHSDANSARRREADSAIRYAIFSFTPQHIDIKANGIDNSIQEIKEIECNPMNVSIRFDAGSISDYFTLKLEDLSFQFLKGLSIPDLPSGYSYNPVSGVLDIDHIDFTPNMAVINLNITAVNFDMAGAVLDYDIHSLDYSSEINILGGILSATPYNIPDGDIPGDIRISMSTEIGDMEATAFSGRINYSLEGNGLDISPVDPSDLPDFLAQEDTDLRLENPQIYLQVNNPVGEEHLSCQTGMTLTAVRGDERKAYSLDNNGVVSIGYDMGYGPYNFVLSPYMPSSPSAAFSEGLTHVGFSGLSDVLSGNGLPNHIDIDLDNPQVPSQEVKGFRLNSELPGITGRYEFLAPLALKSGDNGSVIVYRDREDGWNDEEVEKITIEVLELEADVTSTIPLRAELSARPVDKNGNLMDVSVDGGIIEANAVNQHIVLRTTGTVKGLDGISFEAVVRPDNNGEAIGPDQTIELRNIRARVTGNYTTDF